MPKRKQPLKGNPFKRATKRSPLAGKSPLATSRTRTPINLGALGGAVKDAILNTPLPTGGTVGMAVEGVMPFVDVARDPNLLTGATAAVAIPTLGRGSIFRRLVKAADEGQLIGPADLPERILKLAQPFPGRDKIRRGRTYFLDIPLRKGELANRLPGELDRVVMVQDPVSGAIFVGPRGSHHDHLISRLRAQGLGDRFIQHEVFPAYGDDVPARINQRLGYEFGEEWRQAASDSKAATMGRVRLLRELQRGGARLAPPALAQDRFIGLRR